MFTLAQIDELHARLGRAASLADYMRGLAAIGVVRFDSFLFDGHTEFYGDDGQRLASPAHHEVLTVAEMSDRASVVEHLRRHSDGETSYVEMSEALANSGVEKWVGDTAALTFTYRDRAGKRLLIEHVE
ncbi:DUF1398 domain-containing protein [Phycicoccus sp. Soil802]|uniref:DUF1398 domain-containing protein n=1 Tax=Phycicoccus sp. Soil802 TaxID=1736414 RepID=UPI0007031C34|nr:DUF1398 family protein [Phycicoccus sp. Soil802]KRF30042.1 hypothetical protein ASG91_03455 [Phycicoccus sp. Soil802]